MKNQEQKHALFLKYKGEILGIALHAESMLDFFISNYLIKPQNQKTFFFEDKILLRMRIPHKLTLFKEICKREKFEEGKVKKVVDSIMFIQETRNSVAHWQSELIGGQFQLRKRKSYTTKEDTLVLNEELIDKLRVALLKVDKGVSDLYIKYTKEGTIDEKDDKNWDVM